MPCRRRGSGSTAPTPATSRTSRGWLTTVVARVCLDMLRTRTSRREEPLEPRRSRSSPRRTRPEQDRDARRLGRPRAAGRARQARAGGADRVRAPRSVRDAVRRDRADRRRARRRRRASSRAARAGASRGGRAATSISRASATWSTTFIAALRAGDVEALVAVLDPDAGSAWTVGTRTGRGCTRVGARCGRLQARRRAHAAGAWSMAAWPRVRAGRQMGRVLVFEFVGRKRSATPRSSPSPTRSPSSRSRTFERFFTEPVTFAIRAPSGGI